MKKTLRQLFSPLLKRLESGNDEIAYENSHRTILNVMGVLFCGLASYVATQLDGDTLDYLLPVVIFGMVGLFCLIVGILGNDRAVAKVWGSKK